MGRRPPIVHPILYVMLIATVALASGICRADVAPLPFQCSDLEGLWERYLYLLSDASVEELPDGAWLAERNAVDGIYREYLKRMFESVDAYCEVDDPLVRLINALAAVQREAITWDEFGRRMMKEEQLALPLHKLDELTGRYVDGDAYRIDDVWHSYDSCTAYSSHIAIALADGESQPGLINYFWALSRDAEKAGPYRTRITHWISGVLEVQRLELMLAKPSFFFSDEFFLQGKDIIRHDISFWWSRDDFHRLIRAICLDHSNLDNACLVLGWLAVYPPSESGGPRVPLESFANTLALRRAIHSYYDNYKQLPISDGTPVGVFKEVYDYAAKSGSLSRLAPSWDEVESRYEYVNAGKVEWGHSDDPFILLLDAAAGNYTYAVLSDGTLVNLWLQSRYSGNSLAGKRVSDVLHMLEWPPCVELPYRHDRALAVNTGGLFNEAP